MKGRQYFLPASHAGTVEVLVFMYMANTLWHLQATTQCFDLFCIFGHLKSLIDSFICLQTTLVHDSCRMRIIRSS